MPSMAPNQLASMLHHPQYMAAGLAPAAAAFYGLQQPAMYGYSGAGLEDLAAIQRASASALHTLVGSASTVQQAASAIKVVCKQ